MSTSARKGFVLFISALAQVNCAGARALCVITVNLDGTDKEARPFAQCQPFCHHSPAVLSHYIDCLIAAFGALADPPTDAALRRIASACAPALLMVPSCTVGLDTETIACSLPAPLALPSSPTPVKLPLDWHGNQGEAIIAAAANGSGSLLLLWRAREVQRALRTACAAG